MAGISVAMSEEAEPEQQAPPRRPFVVKPIFTYPLPVRQPQTSWRNWGGLQSKDDASREVARIQRELDQVKAAADFPLQFLPMSRVRGVRQLAAVPDIATADALRMSAIIPMAQTTACLPLSVLNDAGYLAFCEADFVAIPAAMLLANISGRPAFFAAPGFPHEGLITLAHCSAPRKMDGQQAAPARIMTHFESDFGAAPRVQMQVGQAVTMVVPDFASQRWLGLLGEIQANPFLAICRSQVDVRFQAPSLLVAERMPGYRWVLGYGDYRREIGYALRRVPIEWECRD